MRREGEEEGVEEREGGSTAKKLKIIRKKIGVKKEKDGNFLQRKNRIAVFKRC